MEDIKGPDTIQEEPVEAKFSPTQQTVYDYINRDENKGKSKKEWGKDLKLSKAALSFHLNNIRRILKIPPARIVAVQRNQNNLTDRQQEVYDYLKGNTHKSKAQAAADLNMQQSSLDNMISRINLSLSAVHKDDMLLPSSYANIKSEAAPKFVRGPRGPYAKKAKQTKQTSPSRNMSERTIEVYNAIQDLAGKVSIKALTKTLKIGESGLAYHLTALRKAGYNIFRRSDDKTIKEWNMEIVKTAGGNTNTQLEKPARVVANRTKSLASSVIPGAREQAYVNIMLADSETVLHLADMSDVWIVGNNVKLKQK